jgi:phosphoribosylcarboxyaminoimidazole (NCAIR) mutase
LVNTALDIVPDAGLTVVRVVSEVNPAKSDVALAAATKRTPAKKVALEREMAASRARRMVATPAPAAAALGGGTVNQTPRPTVTPPVQVSSYGAADPGRP